MNIPLITFIVPCYNSAEYVGNCLETLILGDKTHFMSNHSRYSKLSGMKPAQLVEILVINDGSTDNTAEVVTELAAKYPEIKLINQENKGHGGAINTGISQATGKYVKVVDSDDKLDKKAYLDLLSLIYEQNVAEENNAPGLPEKRSPDLIVTNFIYDKVGKKNKMAMRYRSTFPKHRTLKWNDIRQIKRGTYLLMHSLTYRLDVLKKAALELPEHTFYVDNLYAFIPLGSCKTIYYLDVDLYYYFIGRDDQSVQLSTMIKRFDQQLRVNDLMFEWLKDKIHTKKTDQNNVATSQATRLPVKLQKYLLNYFEIITFITSIIAIHDKSGKHRIQSDELWLKIKQESPITHNYIDRNILGKFVQLRGWKLFIPKTVYRIYKKIYGFN